MTLKLFFHPLAAYCHKVLIALYEAEVPFETELVDLGDTESRAAHLARWPLGKMPVLHDPKTGRMLPETSIIIEYLDVHYPGAGSLFPADPDARLEARLWDRIFDIYVSTPLQKIVVDHLRPEGQKDPAGVADAFATLDTAYDLIDAQLARASWAAGEDFSIADCAAAPALFYTSTIHPFADRHASLSAYFDRLMNRPSVARVIAGAKPYFHMYPFQQDIPARFR